MKRFFVSGIGTDVGKTIASAIFAESLEADYWKPIQAGSLNNTDTMKVRSLISNSKSVIHPETFRLSQPMSPHAAAEMDQLKMKLEDFILPETTNTLIIEGAGGVMVPLNDASLMIDLIEKLHAAVILVSSNYLGSINHTLLSVSALRSRNIPIAGIVFNGKTTPSSEEYILKYTGLKCLLNMEEEKTIDKNILLKYKELLQSEI
jgi:dethiobiotin synthetase